MTAWIVALIGLKLKIGAFALPAIGAGMLLKLTGKGSIAPGADADLVCLDDALGVRHVMAGGRWMVEDGAPVVKGTFED